MLKVKTPSEVTDLLTAQWPHIQTSAESVPAEQALGRILAQDVFSTEDVPGFDRSTVDGYALHAADTFGCSESIPAILSCAGRIEMGQAASIPCPPGACFAIPTGGMLPPGADAVVMIEHTETYGDGTVGILNPAAPGENLIFCGDDIRKGHTLLRQGLRLQPHHIGAMAAAGVKTVSVRKKPTVGILSTGNELVDPDTIPQPGQVRDVNSRLLAGAVAAAGGTARQYGMIVDDLRQLKQITATAAAECDMVLISGGSSVGERDVTLSVLNELGTVLLHGIAMKPGKPTIISSVGNKPVFGLPGHPVAAYFVFLLFAERLIAQLAGNPLQRKQITAVLGEALPSNHGREEYIPVRLAGERAIPIRGKSGLITLLTQADGYIVIPRDCEGRAAGSITEVTLF